MIQKANPAYKHGHARRKRFSPEYHSWAAMMTRCYNKKRSAYKYYGGKGIFVCKRWHTFTNFLADMGKRPEGKTLDRVRGNRGYSPSNCRWVTRAEQTANRPKKPITKAYASTIVLLLRKSPKKLPELYKALRLHPEVIKHEIRQLRANKKIKTCWVPGVKRGRTLLCEFNGRNR